MCLRAHARVLRPDIHITMSLMSNIVLFIFIDGACTVYTNIKSYFFQFWFYIKLSTLPLKLVQNVPVDKLLPQALQLH